MSLLMYEVRDDHVLILSDTLVTEADRVTPVCYQSKVWLMPERNMAMALTGTAEIGLGLFSLVEQEQAFRDIEEVNEVAPLMLRHIRDELEKLRPDNDITTVYLFGFPAGSDRPASYTYTSRDGADFAPKPGVAGNFAYRPGAQRFTPDYPVSAEDLVELACKIRDEQDQLRSEGLPFVRIGGELHATRIENGQILTSVWHRFDDYDESLPSLF